MNCVWRYRQLTNIRIQWHRSCTNLGMIMMNRQKTCYCCTIESAPDPGSLSVVLPITCQFGVDSDTKKCNQRSTGEARLTKMQHEKLLIICQKWGWKQQNHLSNDITWKIDPWTVQWQISSRSNLFRCFLAGSWVEHPRVIEWQERRMEDLFNSNYQSLEKTGLVIEEDIIAEQDKMKG